MKLDLVEYQRNKRADHQCEEPFIRLRQIIDDAVTLDVMLCIVPGMHFTQKFDRSGCDLTIDDDEVCALAVEMLDRMRQEHLAALAKIELALGVLK